jgi:PAS domain-containing protein
LSKKPSKPISAPQLQNADAFPEDGERYRIFIEDVADGFYETNLKGDFVFFNQAFARIYGFTRDELQNHNYREFMTDKNIAPPRALPIFAGKSTAKTVTSASCKYRPI